MKTNFCFLLYFLISISASAQNEESILKQIDEQVWKPFMKSFGQSDQSGFQSVHSKEVTRVSIDDGSILNYQQYFKPVPDSIKARYAAWKKSIEIRHIKRIVSQEQAFEVGYYKTTSQNTSTGEKRTGYGKFTVVLRKENGVWKILVDSDSNEGTNEEIFQTGKKIE